MSVFRIQSNVPERYVNESRDFQLIGRLYDCIINGIKVDVDSIENIIDTNSCSGSLLQLLQSKVGFFTSVAITTEDLRIVLDAFPRMIKNKGSLLGIKQAINTFLKVKHLKTGAYLTVTNEASTEEDRYTINIGVESEIIDTSILDALFYYVLPSGYIVNYTFYTGMSQDGEMSFINSHYRLIYSNEYITNSINVTPNEVYVDSLPNASEDTMGSIFVVADTSNDSAELKYFTKLEDNVYYWTPVVVDDYNMTSFPLVSKVSKYYPMADQSNPDTHKALLIPDYSTQDSVCGYYYNGRFYSDRAHHTLIVPVGESNKLCYYDIAHKSYYVYTSSYNSEEDITPKYVLIVHEEDI